MIRTAPSPSLNRRTPGTTEYSTKSRVVSSARAAGFLACERPIFRVANRSLPFCAMPCKLNEGVHLWELSGSMIFAVGNILRGNVEVRTEERTSPARSAMSERCQPTYGHATHGKLNVRRALTPPANPRERADLCATSPADRCLISWLDVVRADDLL